jgi:hypothetical protein
MSGGACAPPIMKEFICVTYIEDKASFVRARKKLL